MKKKKTGKTLCNSSSVWIYSVTRDGRYCINSWVRVKQINITPVEEQHEPLQPPKSRWHNPCKGKTCQKHYSKFMLLGIGDVCGPHIFLIRLKKTSLPGTDPPPPKNITLSLRVRRKKKFHRRVKSHHIYISQRKQLDMSVEVSQTWSQECFF